MTLKRLESPGKNCLTRITTVSLIKWNLISGHPLLLGFPHYCGGRRRSRQTRPPHDEHKTVLQHPPPDRVNPVTTLSKRCSNAFRKPRFCRFSIIGRSKRCRSSWGVPSRLRTSSPNRWQRPAARSNPTDGAGSASIRRSSCQFVLYRQRCSSGRSRAVSSKNLDFELFLQLGREQFVQHGEHRAVHSLAPPHPPIDSFPTQIALRRRSASTIGHHSGTCCSRRCEGCRTGHHFSQCLDRRCELGLEQQVLLPRA